MTEYSYSLNEEDGFIDDIYDCITEYIDNEEVSYPFEIEVYKGEQITFEPSHFMPDLADNISDAMADEVGEWGDSWIEKLTKNSPKLQKDIEKFFDKWCEENDCEINFHNIDNVVSETWIVRSEDDYEVKK